MFSFGTASEKSKEGSLKQAQAPLKPAPIQDAPASPPKNGKPESTVQLQEAQVVTASPEQQSILEQAKEVVAKVEEAVKQDASVEQPLVTSSPTNGANSAISQQAPTPETGKPLDPREALQQLTVNFCLSTPTYSLTAAALTLKLSAIIFSAYLCPLFEHSVSLNKSMGGGYCVLAA